MRVGSLNHDFVVQRYAARPHSTRQPKDAHKFSSNFAYTAVWMIKQVQLYSLCNHNMLWIMIA